ncbi:MAG: hypothetical protein KAT04_06480 [Methylococcales bacterium]|nr:hypothetical protein [Methylococcales bacterium]
MVNKRSLLNEQGNTGYLAIISNLERVQHESPVISILETTAEYEKSQQIESDFDKETKAFFKAQENKGADDGNDS